MHQQETQTRLTFVVGAVHFDHHVIQLLLLQHADSLSEGQMVAWFTVLESFPAHFRTKQWTVRTYRLDQGWAKGVINVTHGFGHALHTNEKGKN